MMLGAMPQNKIYFEATTKQGVWNTRLRKTKAGVATRKAAALREQVADDKQRLEDREIKRRGMKIMRNPRAGIFGGIPRTTRVAGTGRTSQGSGAAGNTCSHCFPPASDDPE